MDEEGARLIATAIDGLAQQVRYLGYAINQVGTAFLSEWRRQAALPEVMLRETQEED